MYCSNLLLLNIFLLVDFVHCDNMHSIIKYAMKFTHLKYQYKWHRFNLSLLGVKI